MKTAIELIAEERNRQITSEGYTPEHDDTHTEGELSKAAAVYAYDPNYYVNLNSVDNNRLAVMLATRYNQWPFEQNMFNPAPNDRIRELVKAGALIVAEIERLQRKGEQ